MALWIIRSLVRFLSDLWNRFCIMVNKGLFVYIPDIFAGNFLVFVEKTLYLYCRIEQFNALISSLFTSLNLVTR